MLTKRMCLAAAVLFVLTAPTMAQRTRGDRHGPGWLARRCIATMETLADRAVHHIGYRTQYCIRSINALLDEGAEEEAHAVARRCVESVRTAAESISERIHRLAAHCIARLEELGASDRATSAVRRAATHAHEVVKTAAERSSHAIAALFD